jgi:hypothetical protein
MPKRKRGRPRKTENCAQQQQQQQQDDNDDEDEDGDDKQQPHKEKEDDENDDDEDLLYPTRFAEKHMQELVERNRQRTEKSLQHWQQQTKQISSSSTVAFKMMIPWKTIVRTPNTCSNLSPAEVKARLHRDLNAKTRRLLETAPRGCFLPMGPALSSSIARSQWNPSGCRTNAILTTDDRTLNMVAPMKLLCRVPHSRAKIAKIGFARCIARRIYVS